MWSTDNMDQGNGNFPAALCNAIAACCAGMACDGIIELLVAGVSFGVGAILAACFVNVLSNIVGLMLSTMGNLLDPCSKLPNLCDLIYSAITGCLNGALFWQLGMAKNFANGIEKML